MADKPFPGFPRGARATPVPNAFFSSLLPAISNRSELVVTLYAFYALARKKGYPRFLRYQELAADATLAAALAAEGGTAADLLEPGLRLAVERGTLLAVEVAAENQRQTLFFLNADPDRRAAEQVRQGQLDLGLPPVEPAEPPAPSPPNIFALYEENVGPLSPLIAEGLLDAAERYPERWIAAAIAEAVRAGVRKWSYIASILARWASEGFDYEEPGRDLQKVGPGKRPLSGRYRHLVRH